jgi:hypothetical protein
MGILHIMAFVTLCEAYMKIDPHFDLWNHFFRIWLLQSSGTEAAILDGTDVYVKSGPGVHPYFHLPMFDSMDEWQKAWFFLKNDVVAPLPAFMFNHPIPQLN